MRWLRVAHAAEGINYHLGTLETWTVNQGALEVFRLNLIVIRYIMITNTFMLYPFKALIASACSRSRYICAARLLYFCWASDDVQPC